MTTTAARISRLGATAALMLGLALVGAGPAVADDNGDPDTGSSWAGSAPRDEAKEDSEPESGSTDATWAG